MLSERGSPPLVGWRSRYGIALYWTIAIIIVNCTVLTIALSTQFKQGTTSPVDRVLPRVRRKVYRSWAVDRPECPYESTETDAFEYGPSYIQGSTGGGTSTIAYRHGPSWLGHEQVVLPTLCVDMPPEDAVFPRFTIRRVSPFPVDRADSFVDPPLTQIMSRANVSCISVPKPVLGCGSEREPSNFERGYWKQDIYGEYEITINWGQWSNTSTQSRPERVLAIACSQKAGAFDESYSLCDLGSTFLLFFVGGPLILILPGVTLAVKCIWRPWRRTPFHAARLVAGLVHAAGTGSVLASGLWMYIAYHPRVLAVPVLCIIYYGIIVYIYRRWREENKHAYSQALGNEGADDPQHRPFPHNERDDRVYSDPSMELSPPPQQQQHQQQVQQGPLMVYPQLNQGNAGQVVPPHIVIRRRSSVLSCLPEHRAATTVTALSFILALTASILALNWVSDVYTGVHSNDMGFIHALPVWVLGLVTLVHYGAAILASGLHPAGVV